ncbi:MAG TPA: NAD-dependent epimerase/dehydratase family protein [Hellea balneolensis]|uniref:NAD-dependent epimerase/dehydratase family protein n=1 Tax=Hellea balneolensis TaxID=287478 RepID=A0A7C5LUU2_9PROT|nr:NAD-dependent epimerase/dehydratase family protein [Hellea balneolensis]
MDDAPIIAMTGATGFVGRYLVQNLAEQGYRVKALVRPGSLNKTIDHPNINWLEGELGNVVSEMSLCSGAGTVIHLAGLITARTRAEYFKTNANAVGHLAKTANGAGVKRFVLLSSLAAREPNLSAYAASKRAGEGALARNLGAMKAVAVRAPAVFGAGDKATAPFYKLIANGKLPCPGGKDWQNRVISLVHVDDLVAFLAGPCLKGERDGKTTTIATRARISWPEFAGECSAALARPVKPKAVPLLLLYMAAGMTSAVKRISGRGHLTLDKLREFLHPDWSVDPEFESGTDLQFALKATIRPES